MRELGLPMKYLHEMGEPLLYKRLPEAIDLFPGVCVSTNGTLLNEQWSKDMLSTSLSKLRICIDTLKPEVYPMSARAASSRSSSRTSDDSSSCRRERRSSSRSSG